MKRRQRYALNLVSLGLLLFALYLNFVRKEVEDSPATTTEHAGQTNSKKSTSLSVITPS